MASIGGKYNAVSRVASGNLNFADPVQYRLLFRSGDDVYLATTSGGLCEGVLLNKPNDNEHASVVNWGHAKVTLGQSLGIGTPIMTDGSGYAISASSGQAHVGRLLSAANSGLIAEAFVTITGTLTI